MNSNFYKQNLVIGCVAENTPKFLSQALRLLQSIRWFGGMITDAKVIICVVDSIDPAYHKEFQKYFAEVRLVERFSEKHPQSNKLRFLQQKDLVDYNNTLLLDCDTLVVQDPSSHLSTGGLRGKIADGPTVPHHVFEDLFNFFQLPIPSKDYQCTVRDTATIPYFNAGVLLFSQTAIIDLIPTWVKLNEQLLENLAVLGNSSNFCEQASLSLAMVATKTKIHIFGNEMNLPIQHDDYISSLANIDPLIIHYHNLVDTSGYIKDSQYSPANRRIKKFNDLLRKERGL